MQNLQSALGVFAILAIAFLVSENRRAVAWRPVLTGLAVTFALALLIVYLVPAGTEVGCQLSVGGERHGGATGCKTLFSDLRLARWGATVDVD